MLRTGAPCPQKCSPVIYSTVIFVPPHISRHARRTIVMVYEIMTMRLPRVVLVLLSHHYEQLLPLTLLASEICHVNRP